MFAKILQSKSQQFFIISLCFLIGVGASSIIDKHIDILWLGTTLAVLTTFIILYFRNRAFRFFLLCILFLILGVFRYQLLLPKEGDQYIYNHAGEKVTVTAVVSAEPDVRLDGVRYIVDVGRGKGKEGRELYGKMYMKYQLHPRFNYGDRLEITCRLRVPEPIEDFRYDKYLARYGAHIICGEPNIKKLSENSANPILQNIFDFKNVLAIKINKLWHEPMASFMAGLLYGYRGGLGSLNELFSRTGVTHIVAISGYNITLIATILMTFTKYLYIPRKKAFWVIVGGIFVFVIFAGASASVVRAGIMGVIVLLARQMGRLSRVGNVMLLTAVIMSLQNPYILIYDAGFQLSFISTLGLVYITPLIEKYFSKAPEFFGIKESLVSTFAAIISTLPLILFQFGRLSIVAPMVNVLILWIIPWIMIVGFFAVVLSFFLMPLAQIVSWFAWAGMKYIVVVVSWFAGLPFAAIDLIVPWWIMILLYGFMLFWIKRRKAKRV